MAENIGDITLCTISGRITDKGVTFEISERGVEYAKFAVVATKARRLDDGSTRTGKETYFMTVFDKNVLEAAESLEAGQQVTLGCELSKRGVKNEQSGKWTDYYDFIVRTITPGVPPAIPQVAPAALSEPEMVAANSRRSRKTAMVGAAEPKHGIRKRLVTHDAD